MGDIDAQESDETGASDRERDINGADRAEQVFRYLNLSATEGPAGRGEDANAAPGGSHVTYRDGREERTRRTFGAGIALQSEGLADDSVVLTVVMELRLSEDGKVDLRK
jgi:hypothetical protein